MRLASPRDVPVTSGGMGVSLVRTVYGPCAQAMPTARASRSGSQAAASVASSNRPNDTESESSSVADREEQEELVLSEQESVEGAEQEEPPAAARGGGGRGRGARGGRGRSHGAAPAAAAPVAAPGRGAGRGAAGAAKYTWVNVAQHVFTPRAEFQGKSVPELGAIFDGLLHDSQPYEFFARVDASCMSAL